MKEQLNEQLSDTLALYEKSTIRDAIQYSLLAPGKRVRPLLMMALVKDYGFDPYLCLDACVALEMLQTYSLIHDDLPAMDDDDYRRGQLANHKVYGEAMAILAGDGLLTAVFDVLSSAGYDDEIKVKLINLFSQQAGINGMILGQQLDLQYTEEKMDDIDTLLKIYELKTGTLLSVALQSAAILVKRDHDCHILDNIGRQCGRAFQIQDDIFDATLTTEQLGKTSASDEANHKLTILSFMSIDEAAKLVMSIYTDIRKQLKQLNLAGFEIYEMIEYLMQRKS